MAHRRRFCHRARGRRTWDEPGLRTLRAGALLAASPGPARETLGHAVGDRHHVPAAGAARSGAVPGRRAALAAWREHPLAHAALALATDAPLGALDPLAAALFHAGRGRNSGHGATASDMGRAGTRIATGVAGLEHDLRHRRIAFHHRPAFTGASLCPPRRSLHLGADV